MPLKDTRQRVERQVRAAKVRVKRAQRRVERRIAPKRERARRLWAVVRMFWPVTLVLTAWRRFKEDDCFALAGYLAYTGLLSFFPFLIFLVMTGSYIVGRELSLETVEAMFRLSPPQVAQALKPVFLGIIDSKTGFAAVISAGVGLWAGSNAFEAARLGFNKAYDVREDRPFMRRRLQSLALAAAAAVVFVSLSFLIVLWPLLTSWVPAGADGARTLLDLAALRYVIGLPMFALLLLALHTTLPRARREGVRIHVYTEHREHWTISVAPGVVASTVLWFLGATAFSLYLRYAPDFAGNYGAMAGVVITLLFFYMSSIMVFFGAQINIAREELRRHASIDGRPLPEDPDAQGVQAARAAPAPRSGG